MSKHFFFILLFLTISYTNQANDIDSLELLLQSTIHDTVRLNTLLNLGRHHSTDDLEKGILFAKEAVALSENIGQNKKTAEAYAVLGNVYFRANMSFDTIISVFNKGYEIVEKYDFFEPKVELLNIEALAYQKSGQLDKAFEKFQRILEISEQHNAENFILKAFSNMAVILNYQEKYEKSKEYFLRAFTVAKKIDNPFYIAILSNNLAEIYKKTNEVDSALVSYKRSLKISRTLGNQSGVALILSNIGDAYIKKKQYKEAKPYLEEAYQMAKENNYARVLGVNLFYQTRSYFEQEMYALSIKAGEEGLNTLGENGFATRKADLYELLSLAYEATGNYKQSLKYRKSYQTLNDSLFSLEKDKQVQSLEIKYEVKQKATENELLKSKTKDAQRIIKNQTVAALGLMLALLLAIGWGFFIYRTHQKGKQLNQILESKVNKRTTELQIINKELEQANHELRTFNYIASHDIKEPIRIISGYSNLIFKQLPDNLKIDLGEYFDNIKRGTQQIYTLVEDFAYYLTLAKGEVIKTESVDLNLLTFNVMDSLQESISKYHGEVLVHNLPNIKTSNTLLFTALKNLIENGLKYNESETPIVEIKYQKTTLHHQITVSDNGIGINEKYHGQIFEMFKRLHHRGKYEGTGIGLAIVKLVVEKLDGSIEIVSENNKGTQFIINLPIDTQQIH